jgi:hypothetical protein
LRDHLLTTIVACREEGTRAAEPERARDLDALSKELGDILVRAGPNAVGGN